MKDNMREFILTAIIAILAGSLLLISCEKRTTSDDERDAVVHITVVDEQGTPQAGIPVLIFDEAGYAGFRNDRKTAPLGFTLTLPGGAVEYRLPYQEWFRSGACEVIFVVMEEQDEENYRIWSEGVTIRPAERVKVKIGIDRSSAPTPPADPETPQATQLEMYDPENGATSFFAGGVTLDKEHMLTGNDRYSIIDAGAVGGLGALGEPVLGNRNRKVAVEPGHGYFICKEISLMEFPSGKWGMGVSFELARVYAEEWILRDGKQVGIKLSYAIQTIGSDELPAWKSLYEVKIDGDRSVTIPLSPESKDSECVAWGDTPLRIGFAGDHVRIEVQDPKAEPDKEYRFFIRSGIRYTEASIRLVR